MDAWGVRVIRGRKTRQGLICPTSVAVVLLIVSLGCGDHSTEMPPRGNTASSQSSSNDLLGLFAASNAGGVNLETSAEFCECLGASSGCEYVDLRGDRRRAVQLVAGSIRRVRTRIPIGSRLRFSFSSYGVETTFSVTVSDGNDRAEAKSFAVPSSRGWQNADIELYGFDGIESEIVVSVGGAGDVAFAMPRLVTPPAPEPAEGHENVILYLIDTLRSDHVTSYGYQRATTPFIDELGRRGLVYLNSYSTSAWTRPSTTSLLTGLFPSFHQANARMRLPLEVQTIAETLRSAGWSTWAFVTNGNVNAAGLDFEQGFDRFVAIKSKDGHPNANQINDLVIPWLDEVGDEPFFLYLHSVDPHAPYDPPTLTRGHFTDPLYGGPVIPEETKKKILARREPTAEDLAFIRGLYDEEILFQDTMIRDFFSSLDSLRLTERTFAVLTSDHGEEFFEHGYWEHGKRLFEEQIRVPLIVVPPASAKIDPGRISSPVQGVDVVPSILEWLGVDHLQEHLHGVVLPISDGSGDPLRAIYCEEIRHDSGFDLFSLKDGSKKIITKVNRKTEKHKDWLFDLEDDPLEQDNLFSKETRRANELIQRLRDFAFQELSGQHAQPVPEPQLEQDALDQLKALGYIE